MKKLLMFLMTLALALALTACSSLTKTFDLKSPEISPPAKISQPGEPLTEEEVAYYMAKIKANLTVERTGRQPQNLADIQKFAQNDDGKPFYMINLIREHKTVQYPDTWKGERAQTVLEAKKLYGKACYPLMKKSGSYSMIGVTFPGQAVVYPGTLPEKWDQFYLISYPNRKGFMELLASDAYADALVHKYAGDKETLLIPVYGGKINFRPATPDVKPMTQAEVNRYMAKIEANLTREKIGREPENLADIRKFAATDDGKPFIMINLIREHKDVQYPADWKGEKAEFIIEAKHMYSRACYPIIAKTGAYSMVGVAFTGPAVMYSGDKPEQWDQFYLLANPSRRTFMELLSHDNYANALVHKYAGDKDTVLIPVYGGVPVMQEPVTAEK